MGGSHSKPGEDAPLRIICHRAMCISSTQWFGDQDPYVHAYTLPSRSTFGRTSTAPSGGTTPSWAVANAIELWPSVGDDTVVIELWNHNVVKDTLIGQAKVSFSDCSVQRRRAKLPLDTGGVVDCTFICSDRIFSKRLLEAIRARAPPPPDCVLWVALRRALDLPSVQWFGAQDPYVVVTLTDSLSASDNAISIEDEERQSMVRKRLQRSQSFAVLTAEDDRAGPVATLRTLSVTDGGTNPRWDARSNNMLLFVPDTKRHVGLKFDVWNANVLSDDKIASAEVALDFKALANGLPQRKGIPLRPHGTLRVGLCWTPALPQVRTARQLARSVAASTAMGGGRDDGDSEEDLDGFTSDSGAMGTCLGTQAPWAHDHAKLTIKNAALECRVRRGPDWDERRNKRQDGGPGGQGTVLAFRAAGLGHGSLSCIEIPVEALRKDGPQRQQSSAAAIVCRRKVLQRLRPLCAVVLWDVELAREQAQPGSAAVYAYPIGAAQEFHLTKLDEPDVSETEATTADNKAEQQQRLFMQNSAVSDTVTSSGSPAASEMDSFTSPVSFASHDSSISTDAGTPEQTSQGQAESGANVQQGEDMFGADEMKDEEQDQGRTPERKPRKRRRGRLALQRGQQEARTALLKERKRAEHEQDELTRCALSALEANKMDDDAAEGGDDEDDENARDHEDQDRDDQYNAAAVCSKNIEHERLATLDRDNGGELQQSGVPQESQERDALEHGLESAAIEAGTETGTDTGTETRESDDGRADASGATVSEVTASNTDTDTDAGHATVSDGTAGASEHDGTTSSTHKRADEDDGAVRRNEDCGIIVETQAGTSTARRQQMEEMEQRSRGVPARSMFGVFVKDGCDPSYALPEEVSIMLGPTKAQLFAYKRRRRPVNVLEWPWSKVLSVWWEAQDDDPESCELFGVNVAGFADPFVFECEDGAEMEAGFLPLMDKAGKQLRRKSSNVGASQRVRFGQLQVHSISPAHSLTCSQSSSRSASPNASQRRSLSELSYNEPESPDFTPSPPQMHESPPTFASSLHADDDAETQAYTDAYSAKTSFDAYVDEDPTSTLPEEVTIVVTASCVCICRGHGVKQDSVSSADTVAAWPWSSVSSVWGETPDPDPDAMELFVAEVDMIGVYKFQVDYACPIEEALQVNMDACTEAAAKTAEAAANDEFERGCVDQCIEQDTGEIGGGQQS